MIQLRNIMFIQHLGQGIAKSMSDYLISDHFGIFCGGISRLYVTRLLGYWKMFPVCSGLVVKNKGSLDFHMNC